MRFSNFWFRGLERIQNIFISGEVATGKESKKLLFRNCRRNWNCKTHLNFLKLAGRECLGLSVEN